jgi:hypothetical protein
MTERKRDEYWNKLNENEDFRLRLQETNNLLSDLTAGRGNVSLRLHRAGELRRHIPVTMRNQISRWIDDAETCILAERVLRQIM